MTKYITKKHKLIFSTCFFVFLLFILHSIFFIAWNTNDDVTMSMITGGYGFTNTSSPAIVFSNVVWGYFIHLIPSLTWITNYSIISLSILTIIYASICYILYCHLNKNIIYASCITTFLLIFAIVNPQFTINASLLMIASVFLIRQYNITYKNSILVLSCVLAILSFIIRQESFFLIALLSLPILPWTLLKNTQIKISLAILIIILITLYIINSIYYNNAEWSLFIDRNENIRLFADYFIDYYINQNTENLVSSGYSKNDIALLSNWFFVDLDINNPQKLKALIASTNLELFSIDRFREGLSGIIYLFNKELILYTILGLIVNCFPNNVKGILLIIISLLVIFMLAYLGRPAFIRIYYPIIILWIIYGLTSNYALLHKKPYNFIILASLIGCITSTLYSTYQKNLFNTLYLQQLQKTQLLYQPNFYTWGATFPFEAIFPVIKAKQNFINTESIKPYWLTSLSLAPNNILGNKLYNNPNLFREQLANGIYIYTNGYRINLLTSYCIERLSGNIQNKEVFPNIFYVKCID